MPQNGPQASSPGVEKNQLPVIGGFIRSFSPAIHDAQQIAFAPARRRHERKNAHGRIIQPVGPVSLDEVQHRRNRSRGRNRGAAPRTSGI